jgi:hypothetical protein
VRFSRGCPHRCTYCGQHGSWVKWRHRDPGRLAAEVERLHRAHGVNFVTLADENPTTLPDRWRVFLEAVRARRLPVRFFATIRATDVVRDRDILPLYREAGILYVLMGVESTSDDVLRQIRKGSTTREDFQACRLLKEHGIFSIVGHIVGFGGEDRSTFRTALRQLRLYDGDYLNAMYVTPHAWTPFGEESRGRRVVQPDRAKWDYRHQVLEQERLRPWQLFWAVKWLGLRFHLRPRRLLALLGGRDRLRLRQRGGCSGTSRPSGWRRSPSSCSGGLFARAPTTLPEPPPPGPPSVVSGATLRARAPIFGNVAFCLNSFPSGRPYARGRLSSDRSAVTRGPLARFQVRRRTPLAARASAAWASGRTRRTSCESPGQPQALLTPPTYA